MPRPNLSEEKRSELLPVVAGAFAELGYRRATTAELARRTGVQENVLYRLWPDKRAMFIAALSHVFQVSEATWARLLEETDDGSSAAERLVDYESEHLGEFGLHRIVFAGLSETDDPEIREAMRGLYRRFQRFIRDRIQDHRTEHEERAGGEERADPGLSAWALLGIGTVASISKELDLLPDRSRRRLLRELGRVVLEGGA